jgi:16S rRNA (uracil1498-N3)-methyltransferase
VRHSGGLSLILWEEEGKTSLRDVLRGVSSGDGDDRPFAVNFLVGPEGGFTASEIEVARRYGLAAVSLGPRVLRSETAGTVAAAIILYELGDLQ